MQHILIYNFTSHVDTQINSVTNWIVMHLISSHPLVLWSSSSSCCVLCWMWDPSSTMVCRVLFFVNWCFVVSNLHRRSCVKNVAYRRTFSLNTSEIMCASIDCLFLSQLIDTIEIVQALRFWTSERISGPLMAFLSLMQGTEMYNVFLRRVLKLHVFC